MSYFDRARKYGDSEADVKAWQTRRQNAATAAAPAPTPASPIPSAAPAAASTPAAAPAPKTAPRASGQAPHLLSAASAGRAHFARPGTPRSFRGGGELRPSRAPRAGTGKLKKDESNGLFAPIFKAGSKDGHQTRLLNQAREAAMVAGPVVHSHSTFSSKMTMLRALHNRKK